MIYTVKLDKARFLKIPTKTEAKYWHIFTELTPFENTYNYISR